MKLRTFFISILWFLVPTLAVAEPVTPMRGDRGVLDDFHPNAAVWLSDDRLLVSDVRYNNLQIYDLEGRRFRLFDAPALKAPAQYIGLAKVDDDHFLALGSHYHEKNHPRYRDQRSVLTHFRLDGEDLELEDFKKNISPRESLRRTRMWGATPVRQLEFCGIALAPEEDLAWFGLTKPSSEQGTLSLLKCSLKQLLEQDPNLEFTEVDTGWTLPEDGPCGKPSFLSDLATLDDGSFLFLITAQDLEGKRFCSNSLWHWTPGGGPPEQVGDSLAPQNRAMGMAVRSLGNDQYRIALVCDNDTEETGLPATMIVLQDPITIPSEQ